MLTAQNENPCTTSEHKKCSETYNKYNYCLVLAFRFQYQCTILLMERATLGFPLRGFHTVEPLTLSVVQSIYMHKFYAPRLFEFNHRMKQIAVTTEICVIITSQFESKTVGDCKETRRTVHVSSVQCIYSILEMEHVCGTVVVTCFAEYLIDKSVAFAIVSRFGKKLCLFNHKQKLLVTPVLATGIVNKLVNEI